MLDVAVCACACVAGKMQRAKRLAGGHTRRRYDALRWRERVGGRQRRSELVGSSRRRRCEKSLDARTEATARVGCKTRQAGENEVATWTRPSWWLDGHETGASRRSDGRVVDVERGNDWRSACQSGSSWWKADAKVLRFEQQRGGGSGDSGQATSCGAMQMRCGVVQGEARLGD